MQFGLPLIWTEAKTRGFGLEKLASWLSANPARFCGLIAKGQFRKGADADFVVWYPDREFVISDELILYKNRMTPYAGRKVFGEVYETVLRG